MKAASLSCDRLPGFAKGLNASLVIGGQGINVRLVSENVAYNTGTDIFSADVSVQNLAAELMGTSDGVTGNGVKLFFHSGTTVTGGSGTVTVDNEDGTGAFTGSGQPYFQYNQILDRFGGTSSTKLWRWNVPASVSSFSFQVYVQASLPDETRNLRWDRLPSSPTGSLVYAAWSADRNNIWAVANSGHILHFNGSTWAITYVSPVSLYGIFGVSSRDIWAVGDGGTILHYDGVSWTPVASGTTDYLNAVWASGPSDAWAVGAAGRTVHYDGIAWTPVVNPATDDLNAIWGTGPSSVWIVGYTGRILHWTGSSWTDSPSGGTDYLFGVWGSSDSDIWAVGFSSITFEGQTLHWDGSTWSASGAAISGGLFGVWGTSASNIYAAGQRGIVHYNGSTWSPLPAAPEDPSLQAITGVGPEDVWAVGSSGALVHWDGATMTNAAGDVSELEAIWPLSSSSAIVFGTYYGDPFRATCTTSSCSKTPITQKMNGAFGFASGDVWAVGENGSWGHYLNGAWTEGATAVSQRLYAAWGAPNGELWAVGNAGAITHYDPGTATWSNQSVSIGLDPLMGVWGFSASDVWAVGLYGDVVHYDGSSWTVTSGVPAPLEGIWGATNDDIWAPTQDGTVAHYNGSFWTIMPVGSERFQAIHGSAANNIIASTFEGSLYRYDGSAWTRVPTGSAQPLMSVHASSPRDMWVAGNGMTVLHGTR